MAKNEITVRTADTILNEIDRVQRAIKDRAYELFRTAGSAVNSSVADWFNAEHELVWKPAVEVRRKDGEYEVLAATAGVPAQDLDIQVTSDDLLIKGRVNHRHSANEGNVQLCEFQSGELFRSVHFPEAVNPNAVKAQYKDGLLRVTAPIAAPVAALKPTKVEVSTKP